MDAKITLYSTLEQESKLTPYSDPGTRPDPIDGI